MFLKVTKSKALISFKAYKKHKKSSHLLEHMKRILLILLLMLLVPALCLGKVLSYEIPETEELNLATSSTTAIVKLRILDADHVKHFELSAGTEGLNRNVIEAEEKDYIILNVRGKDSFSIPELNISVKLDDNMEKIEFDAPIKNDYDFYLDGEKGKLEIKRNYFW